MYKYGRIFETVKELLILTLPRRSLGEKGRIYF